jgi:hypothetical protein
MVHYHLQYALKELCDTYLNPNASDTLYLVQQQLKKYQVTYNAQTKKLQIKSSDNNALAELDTTDQVCKAGAGYAAWAMDLNGNLYVHSHKSRVTDWARNKSANSQPDDNQHAEKYFYHSSFFAAKPGICFGMLSAEAGRITSIDYASGHYKPTEAQFGNAVQILQAHYGVDTDKLARELNSAQNTAAYNALDLLCSLFTDTSAAKNSAPEQQLNVGAELDQGWPNNQLGSSN